MKCTNCGFESEKNYSACPQCQKSNPAAQKVLEVLKNPLFLVVCILMSVSCVLSISDGGLPLLNILITVFLWLTYAGSGKDVVDANHLRSVSGTVFASYVINYVFAGLVLVMGIVFTVAFAGVIVSDPTFPGSLLSGFVDVDPDILSQVLGIVPGVAVVIFVLVAAVIVVLNMFSLRYIHCFVRSVYRSIETGSLKLEHTTAAKVWLFIFGGLAVLGGLLEGQLGGLADGAVCIIAGLLIHKYLSEKSVPV